MDKPKTTTLLDRKTLLSGIMEKARKRFNDVEVLAKEASNWISCGDCPAKNYCKKLEDDTYSLGCNETLLLWLNTGDRL